MGCAARDLSNVAKSIDERWNIAGAHLGVADTESPLAVAAHRVNVATVPLYKDSVLFAAAHVSHHDIEAADLWQVVYHLLAADAELSIVIVC